MVALAQTRVSQHFPPESRHAPRPYTPPACPSDALRLPNAPDRYRHVYEVVSPLGSRWRAKIRFKYGKTVPLGTHPTPRAAALAAARWYMLHFGDDWKSWVGHLHPQHAVRGGAWRVEFDGTRWHLTVWDEGCPMRPKPAGFDSRAAAWAYYLGFRAGLGLLAGVILTRLAAGACPGKRLIRARPYRVPGLRVRPRAASPRQLFLFADGGVAAVGFPAPAG